LVLVIALCLAAGPARAADREWTGAVNNYWSVIGNWAPTGPGANDRAVFTDSAANHTITLFALATTVDGLRFDSLSPYVISDGWLSLGDLTSAPGFVTHELAVDVDVAPGSTWTINNDATVEVSGQLTADGGPLDDGVTKAGSGTLILSGNNDNVPTDLRITDGVVRLNGGAAFSDSDTINMENAAILRLDNDETIGGLSGFAQNSVQLAGNALTFNVPLATQQVFVGTIAGDDASLLKKTGLGLESLAGNVQVGGFSGTAGTFRITNGTFTMPDAGVQKFRVLGADASIEVRNGATVQLPSTGSGTSSNGECFIGDGSQLLITGAGSSVLASRANVGGIDLLGTLTVAAGGRMDVTLGADPTVFVGANTLDSALGALRVENGGAVETDRLVVGFVANNTGSITVQGIGSTLEALDLYIGGYSVTQSGGTGALTISDGGSVTLLNGLDVWTSASSITVNGGVLSSPWIATHNGASPTIEISDPANGSALLLGGTGFQPLTTINYGITDAAGGPGSIVKTGQGLLNLAHGCTYSGGLNVTEGSARLRDAARQFDSLTGSGPVVFSGQTLDGTGVIAGALSVEGTAVLEPSEENGAGIGLIECGSLSLAASTTLEIQFGGTSSFDKIRVDGAASLSGTLQLSYTGGFTASAGQWFKIIDAGGVTSEFDTIVWPDGQHWAAYKAGGSLWVGVCDASTDCLAECIEQVQVYRPGEAAAGMIGVGDVIFINRNAAGIELAYVGNPTLGPVTLATIPSGGFIPQNATGMAFDNFLFASAGGAPRLYDLSNLNNTVFLWSTNLDSYDVAMQGNLLAIAHSTGLALYDISNPAVPVLMNMIPAPLTDGLGGTVTFHDGLLFWSWQSDDFFTGEVVILNVDNPSNAVELGAIAANFFVSEPQFAGDIMLLSNGTGVRAIDISDVTNPTQVASISLPGIDPKAALVGGLLYRLSDVGLTVLDVSDPSSPAVIDNLVGFSTAGGTFNTGGVTYFDGVLYVAGWHGLSFLEAGDADLDGVVGVCDLCDGNDASGDSDGDGICDDIDPCPTSPYNDDSDGDGVADGCDIEVLVDFNDANVGSVPSYSEDGFTFTGALYINDDTPGSLALTPSGDETFTLTAANGGAFDLLSVRAYEDEQNIVWRVEGHFASGQTIVQDLVITPVPSPIPTYELVGFNGVVSVTITEIFASPHSYSRWDDFLLRQRPPTDCNGDGLAEPDADGDGVGDDCDVCPGFDDTIDADGDGVPDACDIGCGNLQLGDVDANGVVEFADAAAMSAMLLDPTSGTADQQCAADVNEDGAINGLDIQAFLDLLLNP